MARTNDAGGTMNDLRLILVGLALLLSLPMSPVQGIAEDAAPAAEEDDPPCPNGAIFKSDDGREFIAIRKGTVYAPFAGNGVLLPGLALEFELPSGVLGYIYGPMRSSFFITDATVLAKYGVNWLGPTSATGFFRIMTDDGNDIIMHLEGDRCR
jgi:hypothetical protein